jgi:p-cumate 2,3-dioxygenase beta subunit
VGPAHVPTKLKTGTDPIYAEAGRAEVEDFLYQEAALLDAWKLDEWLALLTEDAFYRIPSNDRPDADSRATLFTIADDMARIRSRVTRLKDRNAHAEFPPSRTRRLLTNIRITEKTPLRVEANFVVYRYRRDEDVRQYVGRYRYLLRKEGEKLKIAGREAILDSMELGSLGAVSFIL